MRQRQELGRQLEAQRATLLNTLQQQAHEFGFAIQLTPQGIMSAPLNAEGQPLDPEGLAALTEDQRDLIAQNGTRLEQVVQEALAELPDRPLHTLADAEAADRQARAFAMQRAAEPRACQLNDVETRFGERDADDLQRFFPAGPGKFESGRSLAIAYDRQLALARVSPELGAGWMTGSAWPP